MPARLLVLGIDAVSPPLLRHWAKDGSLPAIRGLMDRGTSGTVRGVRGFFIGSTWPSFYTGCSPAGHGFYRIEQLRSGTYEFFRPLDSPLGVGGTPFWRLASDAGGRVAVLDVPLTRLDPHLNGLQIVEWGGHDAVFGFHASPPEIVRDVLSSVGPYPLPTNCDGVRRSAADFERFVAKLELAVARKTQLTLDLLEREDWDLFVQVFTEAHCAGHQCWHIHDPAHPAHDPALLAAVGDPLKRVYRAIDRAVAALLERVGDAQVLLISPHGMAHYRGAAFLLAEILVRLGVTAPPPRRLRDRARSAAAAAWRNLPENAREALRPLKARFASSRFAGSRLPRVRADVAKSMCFSIPNGEPVGGIRLNLAGREPQGVLEAGPATDAFCEELVGDLRAIIDERSGRPLIGDVYRTDALYTGSRRAALPDLLVEWDGDLPIGTLAHAGGRGATVRATSAKIGTVTGTNAWGRTGEHVPTGSFVFVGPGVPATRLEAPVSVVDFHPTICALMGLPDPSVDGAVIPELVAPCV
ncbi:MAG TPA: alkaline phosphatase family protein [Burkholderiales bacterium]|nr:alkaline phosphatase family protein [Burkholderiales bacterium]